jgi:hypothetical protein
VRKTQFYPVVYNEEMCADGDISRATFKEHKAEIEAQMAVLSRDYDETDAV